MLTLGFGPYCYRGCEPRMLGAAHERRPRPRLANRYGMTAGFFVKKMIGLNEQPSGLSVTLQESPAGSPFASPIQKSKPSSQVIVKQQGLLALTFAVQPESGTLLTEPTNARANAAQPAPAGNGLTTARPRRPPLLTMPQLQPTPFDVPETQKV